jgi:hypothetical protein
MRSIREATICAFRSRITPNRGIVGEAICDATYSTHKFHE